MAAKRKSASRKTGAGDFTMCATVIALDGGCAK
jgi:hypothetical protein